MPGGAGTGASECWTAPVTRPCPVSGSRQWTFDKYGEYNPTLVVEAASGEQLGQTSLRVFSNQLVFSKEVLELDSLELFEGFEIDGDIVTLHFSSLAGLQLVPGSVVLSKKEKGLMVRVIAVEESVDTTVVMRVESVGLDEIIVEGVWGVFSWGWPPGGKVLPPQARAPIGAA